MVSRKLYTAEIAFLCSSFAVSSSSWYGDSRLLSVVARVMSKYTGVRGTVFCPTYTEAVTDISDDLEASYYSHHVFVLYFGVLFFSLIFS